MMPTIASVASIGAKNCAAAGNSGNANRTKPYVPIFSSTPARMTEPAVGGTSEVLRLFQTGSVRAYAASILLGVVAVLGYYFWR